MTKSSPNTTEPDEDLVYKALASPLRRRILDIVREHPGIRLGEISDYFKVSRFAVRKHIQALKDAALLTVSPDGTSKRHFLNPVPIQFIYDRWLSQYSARWAQTLTGIKYSLEGDLPMNALEHRYEVFIRASAEEVWDAITNPDLTEQFFYGTRVDSTFEPGAPIRYLPVANPEKPAIIGEIIEVDSPKRLVHTFEFNKEDGASRVTYQLEDMGGVTKLTLTHNGFDKENETYRGVGSGWNPILSGMKTLLETGEALIIPRPEHTN